MQGQCPSQVLSPSPKEGWTRDCALPCAVASLWAPSQARLVSHRGKESCPCKAASLSGSWGWTPQDRTNPHSCTGYARPGLSSGLQDGQ